MRSATKSLLLAFGLLTIAMAARADALTEILRTAALKNGLRPASQAFNDKDQELAAVGKRFFESNNVSLNGNIGCRTCHLDEFGSADGLPSAVGIFGKGKGKERALSDGRFVPRNTLPLWGRGGVGFDTFFWDGKVDFSDGKRISQFGESPPSDDALIVAVHLPPLEIREMLNDDAEVATHMQEKAESASMLMERILQQLRNEETASIEQLGHQLGKPADEVSYFDVARSIAAFIRSEFRLRNTKFHEFVFGTTSLTPDELQGGLIFYGKGKCVNCHHGPYFSDLEFHAVPFPQLGFGKNGFGVDYGRFNVTFRSEDLYRFRTPPLVNVAKTAPYGHSGSLAELDDAVVAHFDPLRNIEPSSMSELERYEFFKRMAASSDDYLLLSVLNKQEVKQVVRFLGSLTFAE